METQNIADVMHKNGLMWLSIVSLFSSDTVVDIPSCIKSLKDLKKLREDVVSSSIENVAKNKYIDYIDKGIAIVERDKLKFESEF